LECWHTAFRGNKKKDSGKNPCCYVKEKEEAARALGFTLEEYEEDRRKKKLESKKLKLKGGLTEEGRKRISESAKARWQDQGYRELYSIQTRGKHNHTEETKLRISEAVKLKWQDESYRARVTNSPSREARDKISATLKAKWATPEFRNRPRNYGRSESWKRAISEAIKQKWSDPAYRESVLSAVRNYTYADGTTRNGFKSNSRKKVTDPTELIQNEWWRKSSGEPKLHLKRYIVFSIQ